MSHRIGKGYSCEWSTFAELQRALGVTSFPTLLAIDARGRLVAAPIGLPGPAALTRALQRAEAS